VIVLQGCRTIFGYAERSISSRIAVGDEILHFVQND